MRQIAKKYGVAVSTISEKASRENWKETAERVRIKSEQIMIDRIAKEQAGNAEIAAKTLHTLLIKISEAVELIESSDTQATKQLTQCLKDLKDIGAFSVTNEESSANISLGEGLDEYGN